MSKMMNNNISQNGPVTHRKSEREASYSITFEDHSITFEDQPEIDKNFPDQTPRRPRMMRQKTKRQIRSSIKESGQRMKQDVYSMLFLSKPFSKSFFFALFSIFFQYIILGFLMTDLFEQASGNNVLGIPAGVTANVAVSQAIGVILAVLSSEDLVDALAFFDIILHREIFDMIPDVTLGNWFLTLLLKFTEGCACLIVIFILLLKSESVLSLFLNFAALSFVWAIDDVFFTLAKNGFFGDSITEGAFKTSIITLPKNASKRSIYIRNFSFYAILIAMLIAWGFVYRMQTTGKFVCNHILVQFDDSYEPTSSRFSGHYRLESLKLDNRVVYSNRQQGPNTEEAYPFIGYCKSRGAWTLSEFNKTEGNHDSCSSPIAYSPNTLSFDIITESSSWVSRQRNDTKKKYIPYTSMKLECIDCKKGKNQLRDTCSTDGQCGDDGLCICTKGNHGLSCEYTAPCNLTFVERPPGMEREQEKKKDEMDKILEKLFNGTFQLLENANNNNELVLVQNKPVFFQVWNESLLTSDDKRPNKKPSIPNESTPPPNKKPSIFSTPPPKGTPSPPPNKLRILSEGGEEQKHAVIFFNGYRWVVSVEFNFKQLDSTTDGNMELVDFLSNKFHPYYSIYEGNFMSEPVPQSLPGDKFIPTNLKWYQVNEDDENLRYKDQGSVNLRNAPIPPLKCKENDSEDSKD